MTYENRTTQGVKAKMYDTDDDKRQREEQAAAAKAERRYIKTVYKWQNDMVMVFDQHGEQMPAYQGHYRDVYALILRDAPAGASFLGGIWRQADSLHEITFGEPGPIPPAAPPRVPCPTCEHGFDVSARITGDWLLCPTCDRWYLVVFRDGGAVELIPVVPHTRGKQ